MDILFLIVAVVFLFVLVRKQVKEEIAYNRKSLSRIEAIDTCLRELREIKIGGQNIEKDAEK